MPSVQASHNAPVTGDASGTQSRGGGGGGRRGYWRGRAKRDNAAAQTTGPNAPQQDSSRNDNSESPPINNSNRAQEGSQDWRVQGTSGRGDRGRGGYPCGRGNGNRNIGFLPPPPGLPNRWAALQPTNTIGHNTHGEHGTTTTNGNGGQGSRNGSGGEYRDGRGWSPRGSPFFRGNPVGFSPAPPPDETRPGNWVEFRARGRGSSNPGGGGDRPGTPAEYRGRGQGSYDRGRGVWDDRGRGGWGGRGRGRGNADGGRGRGQSRGRGDYDNTDGQWGSFYHGRNATFTRDEELPPRRDVMEGVLAPALLEMTPPSVELTDQPISLKHFRCIGSYTWLEGQDPTIAVPGTPRRWRDSPLPIQVRFDNCVRMFDENAFHMGSASPLVPLFRAVDAFAQASAEDGDLLNALAPVEEDAGSIDWPSIDFVTDRNNLRKFARWIRLACGDPTSPATATNNALDIEPADKGGADETGSTKTHDDTSPAPTSAVLPGAEWDARNDFRIDLQLGGEKTVLMERWAACARERVVPPKGGCRDNFVREATANAPGCENGAGHYRIVQYDLDDLKMVVRWEVDICVPDLTADSPTTSTSDSDSGRLTSLPPPPVAVDIDELARWDDNTTGSAAEWGVSEPASASAAPAWSDEQTPTTLEVTNMTSNTAATIDIDELAKWDDNTDQAAAWDVSPAPTKTASATCPIEQDSSRLKHTNFDANAIWETPADDPVAAAAAWGDAPPQSSQTAASMWDVPADDGGAAWGVGPSSRDTTVPAQDLKVVRVGTLLPQSAVAELATRSAMFVDRTSVESTFIQLFLTQTPVNLVAVHTHGSFDHVIRQELDAPEFARFNEDAGMMQTVRQLVALLRQVQELVKEHGKVGRLSLVCEKGKLGLYSRVGEEDHLLANELARFAA